MKVKEVQERLNLLQSLLGDVEIAAPMVRIPQPSSQILKPIPLKPMTTLNVTEPVCQAIEPKISVPEAPTMIAKPVVQVPVLGTEIVKEKTVEI